MKRTFVKHFSVALFALLAVMLFSAVGYGQAKIQLSEGRFVQLGGGMRSAFRVNEVGPSTGSYNQTFSMDSIRLYINSEVHKDFQVEVNTEFDGGPSAGGSGEFRLLDAIAKYQPNEKFNIWVGRMLTPSDRSNLDGPYFLSIFDYPTLVSRYPAIFAGRDDGIAVSGKLHEGMVKYAVGVYEGSSPVFGQPETNLYAGRVTINFLDSEPDAGGKSGYYTGSTYYGEKEQVLALAFVGQYQDNIVADGGNAKSFSGYSTDLLYEKKLGDGGVVTFEGAYYKYNIGRNASTTALGLQHGSAFLLQAAYLFPTEIGPGKLQPIARYQDFLNTSRLDLGSNYVIRGHNARVSFLYSPMYFGGAWNNRVNNFTGGAQFQF
jgi:hypothetical protein